MPRRFVALLLASGLLLGLLAGEQLASAQGMRQPSSEASVPAFDLADPAVVEEGSHLFRANCTHYCHGAEGRVSRAPALRGHQFEPGYVYQRIAKGLPPMPAFGNGPAARNDLEDRRVRPLALQREGRLTTGEDWPLAS